jgi:hypothetical protein
LRGLAIERPEPGLVRGHHGSVAPRHERPTRRSSCGHDGQRKSVAHMPTASATTASLRYGRMIEAETETAEGPIKKASQMVLTMGSTSSILAGLSLWFAFECKR